MPIKAACSACKHTFNAPSKYAGKKVKCPECKEPLTLPAAGKALAKVSGSKSAGKKSAGKKSADKAKAAKIKVKCECGQAFGAKPELAGKRVKCPGCSQPITIPARKAGALVKKKSGGALAKPSKKPAEGLGELFDEVGFNPDDGSSHRKCPECRAPMKDEAIICIDCGYNENTGKKMETYRPVTAEDRAKKASSFAGPPPGSKKKAGGWRRWFGRKED